MKFKLFSAIIFATLLSCSQEDSSEIEYTSFDQSIPLNVINQQYGPEASQAMDVYLPANRSVKATKIFVLVHGGGWTSGDKQDLEFFIPFIQSNFPDYAIANINYRLATDVSLGNPKQLTDIQMALDYLSNKSASMHVKPEFALLGMSAGAHLAMQFSYQFNSNNSVKAVCSIVGPTDFTDPSYTETDNEFFRVGLDKYIGMSDYSTNPQLYAASSPISYVTNNSPATLLIYGDDDPLIPLSQGQRLQRKLSSKNVPNEFYHYAGEGHGFVLWSSEHMGDANMNLLNFMKKHL